MAKRLAKTIAFLSIAAVTLLWAGNAWTKSPVATNAVATPFSPLGSTNPVVGFDPNSPSGFATNPVTGLAPNPVFGLGTNVVTGFSSNIVFVSTTNLSFGLATNITAVISNNLFLGFVTNVFPLSAGAPDPFANRSAFPTTTPQPVIPTNIVPTIPT